MFTQKCMRKYEKQGPENRKEDNIFCDTQRDFYINYPKHVIAAYS